MLYSLPKTVMTLDVSASTSPKEGGNSSPEPNNRSECSAASQRACFSGVKLNERSVAGKKTWLVSPGGGHIFHGATKLASSPLQMTEPRLPKTVSVLWTNTAANAAAAGGVAFSGLISFGLVPAVVGGVVVATATAGKSALYTQDLCLNLLGTTCDQKGVGVAPPAYRAVRIPDQFICERKSPGAQTKLPDAGSTIHAPPDGAQVRLDFRSTDTNSCWHVLTDPDGGEASGWLYRVILEEDIPVGLSKVDIDSLDTSNLPSNALPVAACIHPELQFTWFEATPTDRKTKANILKGDVPYIKLPAVDAASDQAYYVKLPVNGDIQFGDFCGATATVKSASGGLGDTLGAVFKSVGDDTAALSKVTPAKSTSSSGK
ncbi:hypothetical protein [Burkholderia lata]|nr:hypothetical protein [Burkholderia lata]